MPERYGIYYAPAVSNPLWSLAAQWLGRDAASGQLPEVDAAGIAFARRFALTMAARRYGFHATLKAPMALDKGLSGRDLDMALKAFAEVNRPLDIGAIALRPIDGFLALVPAVQTPALTDFAAKCVIDFDGFRARASEAERAKRIASGGLSPRQIELLDLYGYPYVLQEFRFHMTLTDRLAGAEHEALKHAAEQWFAPAIGEHLLLDRLVLFHEAEPGAPFTRLRDYPLSGED